MIRKLIYLVLSMVLLGSLASATNAVYLAPSAAGGNTGVDCADAKAYTYFNSSGNWSGSPTGVLIGPGTTVHLCAGTYTDSTAGDTLLSFQGSGASGNPITLLGTSGVTLTNTAYWGSRTAGAINSNGQTYLVIDGGTQCGFAPSTGFSACAQASGAGTSIINNQQNGSSLTYQESSNGIYVDSSNVTVQNWAIENIYVHVEGISEAVDLTGIYGIGSDSSSNLTFQNNYIHDSFNCIDHGYATDATLLIQNNEMFNCGWGIGVGDRGTSSTMAGLQILHNSIHDGYNWQGSGSGSYTGTHINGMHIFTQNTGSTVTGLVEAGNYVWGTFTNTSQLGGNSAETGHIFNDISAGTIPSPQIYNNVFTSTPSTSVPANGFITSGGTASRIYNNIVVGPNGTSGICLDLGSGSGLGDSYIENNICDTMQTAIYVNAGATIDTSNYNVFYNIGGFSSGGNGITYSGTGYGSLSSWTTGTGFDANSSTSNPNLNSSSTPVPFQLNGSSGSAYRSGANLTSLSITGLDSDILGVARPSSGAWDIGAYEYTLSQATAPTCTPVSGIYSAGQTISCTDTSAGAVMCYVVANGAHINPETDGASGCTQGTLYTSAIALSPAFFVQYLYIVAGGTGYTDSTISNYAYSINSSPGPGNPVGAAGKSAIDILLQ